MTHDNKDLTASQGVRRILVVDDNVDAAGVLGELLELFGHQVMVVHNGESAVSQVTQFRPDTVLLDIGLPDISGYQACRRIRELECNQPLLIALTGWGEQEDKDKAAQAGFDLHWTKPVDSSRLQRLPPRRA